ncbi:MAG: YihY/virulence factor BrkB family protein [Nitriliruptoraceae bacterium]|nr:YihY/virulence factor BrkB family protein [Nitriliruptoraceae bacterium]
MSRLTKIREHAVVVTAMAVQERYKRDGADPFAASIGFFAFLSLFPLLLLAISVAGFVLDDPADQVAVAEAITEAIPGFAAAADGGEDGGVQDLITGVVEQRGTVGLIGAVILLLSGLRVVNAAMIATRVVFRGAVQSGVIAKVRQVGALVGLGLLALAGVAASSIAGIGLGALPGTVAVLASLGLTLLLDVGLFIAAYTLLSPTSVVRGRDHLPGALLAAIGWTSLKVVGASYVGNQVDSANALYGALGGVIALMLLFYLAGRLYLYGAELTAVRYEAQHGPLHPPEADGDGAPPSAGVVSSARAVTTDGPPPVPRHAGRPRPHDPGPTGRASTISAGTSTALASREREAAPQVSSGGSASVVAADTGAPRAGSDDRRRAAALLLAVGALVAGYRILGGRDDG